MSAAPSAGFWDGLPLGRGVTLLTHDVNGVAAFNKPSDILSHPNDDKADLKALLNARYIFDGEYFEWAGATVQRLWLLNRLDSATSGVILAAADEDLAEEIRDQFKRKAVRKTYHALVFGTPRQPAELWRDLLSVEKRGGKIRTAAHAGNVPAESQMTLVRAGRGQPKTTLIRLEPKTGRSHQLRVQCAKRHLPIVGDQTYGDFKANREFAKLIGTRRLFLHSTETRFDYEFRGQRCAFTAHAPVPEAFEKFL